MVLIDEIDDDNLFCPNVSWAQRKETISLKVNVSEAKIPKINLTEDTITFQVKGNGARGFHNYKFHLEFFKPIDKEGCVYKITPSHIDIQITKQGPGEWWPRLLPENLKKPHYLKLDFDRWKSESDEEEENTVDQNDAQLEQLKQAMKRDKNSDLMFSKAFYLFLYNAIQFLVFMTVTLSCLFGYIARGQVYFTNVYESVGGIITFGVLLSYLETLHAMTGVVKSHWLTSFMQTTGRCVALLSLSYGGDSIQDRPVVWCLYVAWSMADIIRYPFYMFQVIQREIDALTWLRYHIWIPLYPIGGYCEYLIIKAAAVHIEDDDSFSLQIPGTSLLSLVYMYLKVHCVVLLPAVVFMMRHMWKMRSYKYGGRRKFKAA